jgi:hypothetical protein
VRVSKDFYACIENSFSVVQKMEARKGTFRVGLFDQSLRLLLML